MTPEQLGVLDARLLNEIQPARKAQKSPQARRAMAATSSAVD